MRLFHIIIFCKQVYKYMVYFNLSNMCSFTYTNVMEIYAEIMYLNTIHHYSYLFFYTKSYKHCKKLLIRLGIFPLTCIHIFINVCCMLRKMNLVLVLILMFITTKSTILMKSRNTDNFCMLVKTD